MKPSLTHMKSTGFESGDTGDTWKIRENKWLNINKNKWLYEGNSKSDFERFLNDFWLTIDRSDVLGVLIIGMIIIAVPWFISWLCFRFHLAGEPIIDLFVLLIFLFIIFFIYGIATLSRSIVDFVKYKISYRKTYLNWTRKKN